MTERSPTTTRSPENAIEAARYTVTVRGLVLMSSIGIRADERQREQRVRVSVDLIAADPFPQEDRRRIINYEKIVAGIREVAGAGHIDLCEGFAERVCTICFADPRVAQVRVWVEKLDVFPDADGVGAILERTRPVCSPPDEFRSTRRDGPPHRERLAGLGDIVDPQDLNALLNRR